MLHLLINIYFRLSKTCNTYQWLKKISLAVQQLKWKKKIALACLSFIYGAFRRRKSIEQMPIWLKNERKASTYKILEVPQKGLQVNFTYLSSVV